MSKKGTTVPGALPAGYSVPTPNFLPIFAGSNPAEANALPVVWKSRIVMSITAKKSADRPGSLGMPGKRRAALSEGGYRRLARPGQALGLRRAGPRLNPSAATLRWKADQEEEKKMKITIHENERGLLFKKGKYSKLQQPGQYWLTGGRTMEVCSLREALRPEQIDLKQLLEDPAVAAETVYLDVQDGTLAFHFVNGTFRECLQPGQYAFWTVTETHSFEIADTTDPEAGRFLSGKEIPRYLFEQIPPELITRVEVAAYEKARLYYDGRMVRLLEEGHYFFWNCGTNVRAEIVDTRLQQLNIQGQEILTQDKVTLRINFLCTYRITDYVKVVTEVDNYIDQMYNAAQMALRDYVGRYRLDQLLENKDELSGFVTERLKERAVSLYVEIVDAGIKDVILPGEIRDIMNTVLTAEKKAQANVILRREEVASTRSLLNTARLMEENATLYKLKELEYLERICENVGSIQLNGSGDILSQLAELLKAR